MSRLPEFSPQLDEQLSAEFLAHSLALLAFSLRQDDAMLDAAALRFDRLEPPRDPDLPVLPPKVYPRPTETLIEAAVRALVPPPPVGGFTGRKAELDRAALSLMADRPVVLTGEVGAGKTALLRQLAHDSRIRKRFRRIWWLDGQEGAGLTVGLALNAPNVLRAAPEDQPRLAREYLVRAGTLLLIDDAQSVEWALAFTPTVAVVARQGGADIPGPTWIHLGGLPADPSAELLAALSGQPLAAVQPLAALVEYLPQSLRLLAALMAEDGIPPETLAEFLNAQSEDRLRALYLASFEALPEAYQDLCRALAASPRRWLGVEPVLAHYEKPLVGQRALTFIERRGFIERQGDSIRVSGIWPDLIEPGKTGFAALPTPAETFAALGVEDESSLPGSELHKQGLALIDEGRDSEAEAALNAALAQRQRGDLKHAEAETLSGLARLAYLRGDDATAIRRLETAAERLHDLRDEESLEIVRIALSRVYRRAHRLDAALSVLGDDSPPEDLTAVHRARREWPEAVAVYERWIAATEDPITLPLARLGLTETLALAGRYAEALEILAGFETFDGDLLRAMVYHVQGDLKAALAQYEKIRLDAPAYARGTLARAMARALAAAGDTHEAAMAVGAEGTWYEAKLPRPVFARQRQSLALFAHLSRMAGNAAQAETAARNTLIVVGELPDPESEATARRVLARLAWERGDLGVALREFELELKARESQNVRDEHEIGIALHCIGDVQRERGESDRAIGNYRRALTHKDPARDRRSVLLTQLALRELLARSGRHPEALEVGQAAVELVTRRPEADLRLLGWTMALQAAAQRDFGRAARAGQVLQDWQERLAKRADEGAAHDFWGVRLVAVGLAVRSLLAQPGAPDAAPVVELAEAALRTAEVETPGAWAAWAARRDLGNLYLRMERWSEAYETFEPLLTAVPAGEVPPLLVSARLGMARAAARLKRLEDAIQHFDAALAYEPDPQARGLIVREAAETYRAAGDDTNAAEYDLRALELLRRERSMQTYIDTVVALAYSRLRLRRFGEAIDTFEEALAIVEKQPDPDPALLASVLFDMAAAHDTLGQYRRAATTYRRSLNFQDMRRSPERYLETLIALARAEFALEEFQPAIAAYHDALQFEGLAPDQRRALLAEQADAFARLGQPESAIAAYKAALNIEGAMPLERSAIHRQLGAIYANLGQHEEARGHFEAVLEAVQDDQSGLMFRALGDGYRAQGKTPEAIEAYQQALSHLDRAMFPLELAAAERALGEIYLSSRQAANALKHLDSALDLERAMPQQNGGRIVSILQNLARAHELRGELDRATYRHHEALVYQDVRHEPQGYTETLRTLGRLYTQLKRYGEAARALETALSTETSQPVPVGARIGDMTCALADVYLAQGRLEAAADLYRRAVESEGAAPDVADRAGQSLREIETDIARHLETLAVAEQSWALLNRVSRPAVTELAFIRALEARTNYTLGRWDEAERILERLMSLLRARRTELGSDVAGPAAQALALLLAAQEAQEAGRADEAAVSFREAVALVQADPTGNSSLLWALQHRADEARN